MLQYLLLCGFISYFPLLLHAHHILFSLVLERCGNLGCWQALGQSGRSLGEGRARDRPDYQPSVHLAVSFLRNE